MNSGNGGQVVAAGTLGSNGTFGSLYPSPLLYPGDSQAGDATGSKYDGGQTIRCTKGVYWAQQGVGA